MRNNFATAFVVGLVVIAVAVGVILFMQRGAHMDLPGEMGKVRTLSTGDSDAVALVDLHITNTSDYSFVVRNVTVVVEDKSGATLEQDIASRSDTQRLFDATPNLGPYHPPLYTKATIAARTTSDYSVAATFHVPEKTLQDRKRIVVRIEEVDGKTYQFTEK